MPAGRGSRCPRLGRIICGRSGGWFRSTPHTRPGQPTARTDRHGSQRIRGPQVETRGAARPPDCVRGSRPAPSGERSPHSTACWSQPPLAVLLWVTPAAPRAGREPIMHPYHPALSSQTPGVNSPRTPDDTSTPGPTNRRPILSPSVRLMPRDTTARELRPPSPPRALPLPAELLSDGVSSRHQRRPTRPCQPPGKPPGDFHSI